MLAQFPAFSSSSKNIIDPPIALDTPFDSLAAMVEVLRLFPTTTTTMFASVTTDHEAEWQALRSSLVMFSIDAADGFPPLNSMAMLLWLLVGERKQQC
jgi:hypothetical protein